MESALISSSSWVSWTVKVVDSHVVKEDDGERYILSSIEGQETLGSATRFPLMSSTSNREVNVTGV